MRIYENGVYRDATPDEIERLRCVRPQTVSEQEAMTALARMQLAPMLAALTADDALSVEPLIEPWTPGAYQLGDVRTYGGNVWRCGQAHDAAVNPDVIPGAVGGRAFWFAYHAKTPRFAKLFVQPTCREDAYMKGECCIFNERLYVCRRDYTDRSPADSPEDWVRQ